jgi:ribosomal protein L7/L12
MKIECTTEEMKDLVGSNNTSPVQLNPDSRSVMNQLSAAFQYMSNGDKIGAIKNVRNALGCCLKEAKDVVEGMYHR